MLAVKHQGVNGDILASYLDSVDQVCANRFIAQPGHRLVELSLEKRDDTLPRSENLLTPIGTVDELGNTCVLRIFVVQPEVRLDIAAQHEEDQEINPEPREFPDRGEPNVCRKRIDETKRDNPIVS